MAFYQQVLGGGATVIPDGSTEPVFHSDLHGPNFRLMAADVEAPRLALHILCDDRAEMERFFAELAEGGSVQCGIGEAFGGLYAEVIDPFGVKWFLTLSTL